MYKSERAQINNRIYRVTLTILKNIAKLITCFAPFIQNS